MPCGCRLKGPRAAPGLIRIGTPRATALAASSPVAIGIASSRRRSGHRNYSIGCSASWRTSGDNSRHRQPEPCAADTGFARSAPQAAAAGQGNKAVADLPAAVDRLIARVNSRFRQTGCGRRPVSHRIGPVSRRPSRSRYRRGYARSGPACGDAITCRANVIESLIVPRPSAAIREACGRSLFH